MSAPARPVPESAVAPAPRRENGPFSRANLGATLAGGYLPLILATLVMVLPLLWMIISSFKAPQEILSTDLVVLPSEPSLSNYEAAWSSVPIPRFFLNSVIVTTIGSSIKVLLAIFTAYALVFVRFPFKRVIFVLILVALMVPPQVSILPNYVLIAGLGGVNTYWGIILPGLGTAFGTFLLRQFFLTIPPAILEAAEIDGAGHIRRMLTIVVPLSSPMILTATLIVMVGKWNEYVWPLIVTSTEDMRTLPIGLLFLRSQEGYSNWGVIMAGAVFVSLPMLILFFLAQKRIIGGLAAGAMK